MKRQLCLECMTSGCIHTGPRPVHLTPRECSVARLVSLGLANKEMAARLGISEGTVKFNMNVLFHKLRVNSRLEVALWARDHVEALKEG